MIKIVGYFYMRPLPRGYVQSVYSVCQFMIKLSILFIDSSLALKTHNITRVNLTNYLYILVNHVVL
jgi:hypothetical protein